MIPNQGRLAQEMLRILYCSSEDRFRIIFGDAVGEELWYRYRHQYSGNQGRILVEMTSAQAQTLAEYALKTSPDLAPRKVSGDPGYVLGMDD